MGDGRTGRQTRNQWDTRWDIRWRGLTRLQARRQFVGTLAIASLMTLVALLIGAYLALRNQTLVEEQARLTREAAIASAMMSNNAQILASSPQASTELSDRISAMTGDDTALYQYSGQSLVVVAAHDMDIVGAPLPSVAEPAVVGSCGPVAPVDCHRSYFGVVRTGGVEYAATYAPVFDADGKFVGALMVARPLEDALAGVNAAMLALTVVGTLLALVIVAIGAYRFNRSTGQTLGALQTHLRVVAASTVTMEHAARSAVLASRRQEQLARQIGDGARGLDALVTSVNQGYPALQQSAGAIWAEVSQPGAPPDPVVVMRLARETTLMATRVGAGMEDARVYSDHVTRLMNYVVAQGRIAAQSGQETQRAAQELRTSIERIEAILGGRLVKRDESYAPLSIASVPSLSGPGVRFSGETRAYQAAQSQWESSGVWPSRQMFPSIPPLPATERLPAFQAAREVVNGEVRALDVETRDSVPPPQAPRELMREPARFGDISFPTLMKESATRPLASESEPDSAPAD
jgi:hypothetical protein